MVWNPYHFWVSGVYEDGRACVSAPLPPSAAKRQGSLTHATPVRGLAFNFVLGEFTEFEDNPLPTQTSRQGTHLKLWFALKRLSLGFTFIALAAGVLLLSDRTQRRTGAARMPRVAVLQHASTALLDEAVEGMLDAFANAGYRDGQNIVITRFNAANDLPTDNAIAKEVTDGKFDLVLTASTLSMQAVANANKAGKAIHVFGAVADPFSAGIGLRPDNPMDHPRHLAGIGTFMPVSANFELARRMFPGLKTVGVAWNPAESNSRAFTIKAREACQALGIELLETTVENSSGVGEAATSLVSRGAQALWIGGDVTVMVAADSVIAAAKKGRIPVFTLTPPMAQRGAIFDLGANFMTIGRQTGDLATKILRGANPADFPIEDRVPERLIVNKLALRGLKDPWQIPDDVVARADTLIDESGIHEKTTAKVAAIGLPSGKQWRISLVTYIDAPATEEAEKGVIDGLREAGLIEGRDYVIKARSAQGDIATLNGIMDAVSTEGADMVIPLSTPTLQTAVQKIRNTPIVFALVGNAFIAGAGRTNDEHLPNVTGATIVSPFAEMVALLREVMPSARRCGTVFTPAEVNSAYYHELLTEAGRKAGLEVEAVAASNSSDVADAALALMTRNIDAVCQISDNLTGAAFAGIAKAAERARLPIFSFNSAQAKQGASVVLARDFRDGGRESALLAARVMRGESTASIPFKPTARTKLIINPARARAAGLSIPRAVLQRADEVIKP